MKKLILLTFVLGSCFIYSEEDGQVTSLNGVDIWWEAHGDPKNPAALLIMGLNSNSKVWSEHLIKKLADEDIYVIVYDNRDMGKSSWVTEEPFLLTFIKILPTFVIEAFVDGIFNFIFDESKYKNLSEYFQERAWRDIICIMDKLEIEKAHIVGLSMGGFATLHLGIEAPHRVKSLVIVNTRL